MSFSYRNPESRAENAPQQQQPTPVEIAPVISEASIEANKNLVHVSVECEPVSRLKASSTRIGSLEVVVRLANLSEHFDYDLGLFARNAW